MSDGLLSVLLIIVIGLWCEYPIWGPMIRRKRMLTEEEWKAMPPGSDAAIANGCTCPRMDNGHGEGFMWDGQRSWWIASDCPLHGLKAEEEMDGN